MTSNIFDGYTAWFSTSVDQTRQQNWGKHGGKISTSETDANYIFSDDSNAQDTETLIQSLTDDFDLAIFKSTWIDEAIKQCSTNNKLSTFGIEKFILLPQSVQDELDVYKDDEKYKEQILKNQKECSENIKQFEEEIKASQERSSENKISKKKSSEVQVSDAQKNADKETRRSTRRKSHVVESSQNSSQEDSNENNIRDRGKRVLRSKRNQKTTETITDESSQDESSQESVSSQSSRRSARIARRVDTPRKKALEISKSKKVTTVIQEKEHEEEEASIEKVSKNTSSKFKEAQPTDERSIPKVTSIKSKPELKKARIEETRKMYPKRNRSKPDHYFPQEKDEVDEQEMEEEENEAANTPTINPVKKNKRKLYNSSTDVTKKLDKTIEEGEDDSFHTPLRQQKSNEVLSPEDIHRMLNNNNKDGRKEVLLPGTRRKSAENNSTIATSVTAAAAAPATTTATATATTATEGVSVDHEMKKSRRHVMVDHKKIIEHKRKGEKESGFTYGSFSGGFTHIDSLDIPDMELYDFIANKNGCRVKVVSHA